MTEFFTRNLTYRPLAGLVYLRSNGAALGSLCDLKACPHGYRAEFRRLQDEVREARLYTMVHQSTLERAVFAGLTLRKAV